MLKLNISSHSYHEARQKLERTQIVFRTEVWQDDAVAKDRDAVAKDRDGVIIQNIRDLDQYIENHNGGFCDAF